MNDVLGFDIQVEHAAAVGKGDRVGRL